MPSSASHCRQCEKPSRHVRHTCSRACENRDATPLKRTRRDILTPFWRVREPRARTARDMPSRPSSPRRSETYHEWLERDAISLARSQQYRERTHLSAGQIELRREFPQYAPLPKLTREQRNTRRKKQQNVRREKERKEGKRARRKPARVERTRAKDRARKRQAYKRNGRCVNGYTTKYTKRTIRKRCAAKPTSERAAPALREASAEPAERAPGEASQSSGASTKRRAPPDVGAERAFAVRSLGDGTGDKRAPVRNPQ